MRLRRPIALALVLASSVALPGEHGPAPVLSSVARAEGDVLPAFDPDVVRPRPDSALERALESLREGDLSGARTLAEGGIPGASLTEAMLLRWVAARAARDAGEPDDAAALAEPIALSDHPLAPWGGLLCAQMLEGLDAKRALEHADRVLASPTGAFPARPELERLRARLLGKLGQENEAITELTRLLGTSSDDAAPLQLLLPLADLLSTRTEADRIRALALYRSVAARTPQSKLGKRADERAAAMLASLPEDKRALYREPALETRLTRADALLAELRFSDAESAYDALEHSVKNDPAMLCRVRYGRAKALLDRRAREAGSALMIDVAEHCTSDVDQRAWARYLAGRALSAMGKNLEAIAQYEALEREAPSHRLADDALFRAAKVARDMGDLAGVTSRLTALPERYPHGDMGPRARFALAWQQRAAGHLADAVATLSGDVRDEEGEDTHGRAGYFRARFLVELGQKRDAVEAFADAFAAYPLSYYGQQAYGRLKALDPGRAKSELDKLSHQEAQPITFERRPMLDSEGFARAVALFSAGDASNGLSELRALGFFGEGADAELGWLAVALLDRAQAPQASVELSRKLMASLLARAPRGRELSLYRLAFPRAYAPLIEDTAGREGVPSAFVRAVAREESGFSPRAVSRANARGLIQIIEPTAKAIAKGMGLPAHPEALSRPEVNLALGVRFISTLAGSLRGQYALVPVAYNAGPTVASRWLSERGTEPLDVWVENIPYDETRHYTRRVLQSYGVYHFLETGQLLELPNELPAI